MKGAKLGAALAALTVSVGIGAGVPHPGAEPRATPSPGPPASAFSGRCEWATVQDRQALAAALRRAGCAVMTEGAVSFSTGFYPGPNGNLPFVAMASTKGTAPRRIIILLVGGPGDSALAASEGDLAPVYRELIDQGDVIISPAYAGTRERSFYPRSDLPLAAAEVESLAKSITARQPRIPVILHGISIGGYLAAKIAPGLDGVRLVLLNPVLWSGREFLAWARREPAAIPWDYAWTQRSLWSLSGEGRNRGREEPVPFLAAYESFFGSDLDTPASRWLPDTRSDTAVLFSTRDVRIGPAEAERLRGKSRRLSIVELPSSGHFVRTPKDRGVTLSALRQALADDHPAKR